MAPPSGVLIAKEEEQGNKKKDRTESKIRMKSKFSMYLYYFSNFGQILKQIKSKI